MKKLTLGILLVYHSCFLMAQQDSVFSKLKNLKDNRQKINYLLRTVSDFYANNDTVHALFYVGKLVQVAQENNLSLNKIYYSLGDTLFKFKNNDKALPFFEKADILSVKTKDEQTEAKAILKIAKIYYQMGKSIDTTLKYGNEAMRIARKISDNNLLSESFFVLGDGYKFLGNSKKALEFHLESLKIRENEGNVEQISESLSALGWNYMDLNVDQALSYHMKNIEIQKKLNDPQRLGEALIGLGVCYQRKKEYDKALDYYLQALAIFEAADFKITLQSREIMIATILNDIGWNFNEMGKPEKALPYLKSSLELKEKQGNPQMITYVLHSLGEAHLNLKQYDLAEKYLFRTLKLTQELGMRNDRMVVYDNLYKLEKAKKNFQTALLYKEKNNSLRDSLYSENKNKEIAYVQATFEFEKKDVENKLLQEQLNLQKAEVEKQIWLLVAVIGGLLSFMLMSFFLYRNNRHKHNLNQTLQHQKEEITAQNEEIASQNNEILYKNNELSQLIEELNRVNEYLDDLVKQRTQLLEKQNQQLREYAFINSHKLRAPLASIMGLMNLIKMTDYEKIDKNLIDHLRFSTEKLDMVVHEIQDMLEEVKVPEHKQNKTD